MTLSYELPPRIVDELRAGRYELYAQKQLGTVDHELRFSFQAPKRIIGAEPKLLAPVMGSNQQVLFETNLVEDREFKLGFE